MAAALVILVAVDTAITGYLLSRVSQLSREVDVVTEVQESMTGGDDG